jgi:hypothetical protein
VKRQDESPPKGAKAIPTHDRAFIAVVAAYCIYAALFIYRTSFVIGGVRYFSLFDDAMISMRYAENLVRGHGLVWNPGGERVEGYTNLGWTLYMALLQLLPVAKAKISLLVQASSAVALAANLIFVRKLAGAVSHGSRFVILGAVVVTAFYLPINNWGLQGMEVGLLTLLIGAALWKAVESIERRVFSFWPYALLALAMIVRLDMVVPFAIVLGFLCMADPANRRKHLGWGLGLLAVALAAQTGLRASYYGDILPNTYYQKLTGYPVVWRIVRGFYVCLVFIWRANWIFFLVPAVVLFPWRKRVETLLATIVLGQLAYSIYVGGDAWESWGGANRYICIAMPAFFILFYVGLREISGRIRAYAVKCRPERRIEVTDRLLRRAGIVLVFVSLASFNAIYGPSALAELLLFKRAVHVEDNEKMVERALVLAEITGPRATVAVVWDGAIPFFAERTAISILGKNDKHVGREKMKVPVGAKKMLGFYPGHLKWDYAYSIGQLKPDVVAQLWYDQEGADPYLKSDYLQANVGGLSFYLRRGSPNILWDRVKTAHAG